VYGLLDLDKTDDQAFAAAMPSRREDGHAGCMKLLQGIDESTAERGSGFPN